MDTQRALIAFDALSQETRLRAFRALVTAGNGGLAAGELAQALDVPHNSLSFHLNHMSHAALVISKREGRSIRYFANFALMQDIIRFLAKDCCAVEFAAVHEDEKTGALVIELPACCNTETPTPTKKETSS